MADYIIAGLLAAIGILLGVLLLLRVKKPGGRKRRSARVQVALTDHAIVRMRERMGVRQEAKMLRLAAKAYRYGKRAKHLPAKTAARVREKQKKYGNSTIVIYKGFTYVFSKDRALITVYK